MRLFTVRPPLRLAPLLSILLAATAIAQPGPPEGRRGPGGPGGDDDRPPLRQRDDRAPQDRPGAPLRPGTFEAMRAYLDLVDRYSRLSRDPTTAAVAAVVQTADVLRPRGAQAVIEHYEKLLPEVKNDAVARAIRLQLVDLYRQTQQADKAVAQLTELIKAAPAGAEPAPPAR